MIDLSQELSKSLQEHSRSENFLELLFQPTAKLSYFVGHFPQMPVLPAVGIIDISQFCIAKFLDADSAGILTKMSAFRIKHPVGPGDSILICIQRQEAFVFSVLWKNAEDDKVLAELSLQLSAPVSP